MRIVIVLETNDKQGLALKVVTLLKTLYDCPKIYFANCGTKSWDLIALEAIDNTIEQ